ncbi:ABC transporter permease [Carboxydothermus pertinax]|uniref:ABC transporter permease n=1 Tax=Carboxydothermus pertinax TaxID=870242 RepID=A0A1L8CVK7_9THEO|nr:ABC transporter permease [Carboxydothermus pertinax]
MNVVQNSLLIAALLAVEGSLVGVFLLLRRYSLLADTLAHFSLIGIAMGIFFGFSSLFGGIVAALTGALILETLRQKENAFTDANLALISAGGLSLAIILASLKGEVWQSLGQYLFGSLLFVGKQDLIWALFTFFGVLLFMLFFSRHLLLLSLDPAGAKSQGIKGKFIELFLMILATLVIAGGIQAVGAMLTGAFLVLPALIGIELSRSFTEVIIWAITASVVMAGVGLFITFLLNLPPGATIVANGVLIYILVVLGKKFGRRRI